MYVTLYTFVKAKDARCRGTISDNPITPDKMKSNDNNL